jgi:hypothetical protein
MCTGDSPRAKPQGRDPNKSPKSSAEVKNDRAVLPWRCASFGKHRFNFIFTPLGKVSVHDKFRMWAWDEPCSRTHAVVWVDNYPTRWCSTDLWCATKNTVSKLHLVMISAVQEAFPSPPTLLLKLVKEWGVHFPPTCIKINRTSAVWSSVSCPVPGSSAMCWPC